MPTPKVRNKNTRSFVPFIPFPFQYEYFSKTFFPYTTKLYNKLEHSLRNERDLLEFKSRLKTKYKDKKKLNIIAGVQNMQIVYIRNSDWGDLSWLLIALR